MSSGATANDAKKGGSAGKQLHKSATPPSGIQTSDKGGGGLFDYLVKSRQKGSSNNNHLDGTTKMSSPKIQQRKTPTTTTVDNQRRRMKYHQFANAAAGSQYFGSLDLSDSEDNDSDHERNSVVIKMSAVKSKLANMNAPNGSDSGSDVISETVGMTSPSWFAKFQKQQHHTPSSTKVTTAQPNNTNNNTDLSSSSLSSSWMNKAWQTTIESASDFSSHYVPSFSTSSLSNAISSSINNYNPFVKHDELNGNNNINGGSNDKTVVENSKTNLQSFASRFKWTKSTASNIINNPLLQPSTLAYNNPVSSSYPISVFYNYSTSFWGSVSVGLWGLFSSICGDRMLLFDGGSGSDNRQNESIGSGSNNDGGGVAVGDPTTNQMNDGSTNSSMMLSMRRKSLPSTASVMAVKNLLMLVQQQHLEEQLFQQQQQQEIQQREEMQQVEEHEGLQHQQQQQQQQYPSHSSPVLLLSPVEHQQSTFTPRSPSILPFPDLEPNDSSSFESEHTPLHSHYPSPRMTPVQSFQSSPKYHGGGGVMDAPPPLFKSSPSSSPVMGQSSASLLKEETTVHSFNAIFSTAKKEGSNNTHHVVSVKNTDINNNHGINNNNNQAAEMAARLAEGTLRAYRDLALDEATELHSALHHWTLRWERPFLGWLEAGPTIWLSDKGYSPYSAGKKVSQIQAVLARRCAVIGEIQQHLWRANWQRGVAEWGMLGHGFSEWATVMLEHGDMTDVAPGGVGPSPSKKKKNQKRMSMKIFNHSTFVGGNVSNSRGGQILVDEDALTSWSIDGIKVVRDQLYRAGLAGAQLPYYENWPNEVRHFNGDSDNGDEIIDHPAWATTKDTEVDGGSKVLSSGESQQPSSAIVINNLPGMANEVSALLQSIEINLDQQRQRRLNRLRPPSSLRRNWYMVVLGIPTVAYATYHVCREHGGYYLLKEVLAKISVFYKDHVSEPIWSIYQELFSKEGRIDVNDRKARIDAIESLKRMIRSWLDETFADMPEQERIERANNMDISLVEELKEESIKHIYEINSVVRCSLIEMQFIKKELLNALVAMDELMGSNEINMRIAAMTPAVILMIAVRKVFRVIFYALFKFGASKQEIYASFRKIILDIERLLLMRDNPPPPPESLSWGATRPTRSVSMAAEDIESNVQSRQTLSAADLGMLLLHIHECRNILWQNRRRFQNDVLRNVSEDLAELAGERGPVSVRQQLQILSRMTRTYKFMKVETSGSMIGGVVM